MVYVLLVVLRYIALPLKMQTVLIQYHHTIFIFQWYSLIVRALVSPLCEGTVSTQCSTAVCARGKVARACTLRTASFLEFSSESSEAPKRFRATTLDMPIGRCTLYRGKLKR